MTDRLRVDVYDGKYTIIQEESGGMTFLRHGKLWSEPNEQIRYGNMILAMAYEIDDLRTEIARRKEEWSLMKKSLDQSQKRPVGADIADDERLL